MRRKTDDYEHYRREASSDEEKCSHCRGSGAVDGERCPACDGSGTEPGFDDVDES